jgi:two-component system phosphate regulon sensor histidine kinase PhoR
MTIISEIMDGVVVVDAEGRVALINPVAEELLGAKAFLAMGNRFDEFHPGCEELTSAVLHDHDHIEGEIEITRTVEVQTEESDLIYVQISSSRVYDCERSPQGIITLLKDITSEYKSDQLRNQYLSIVAHELRTPLTGIKTFSTLMANGRLGELSELQAQAVSSIREQSVRLEHQIDKLINLGNLDANTYAQDPEILDTSDLLSSSVAPFQQVAADSGCEILIDSMGVQGVHIQADRTDIKRVLKSLIENAVKFTSGSGTVTAIAEVIDEEVVFTISDTGIGIDPRYQRRIFEKFFQVEDPLTRHHGGAGLGLFVAQGIIEAHGSRIEVTSELGFGASFRFALPVFEEVVTGDDACAEIPSATR